MISSPKTIVSARSRFRASLFVGVAPLLAAGVFSVSLLAQDAPPPAAAPAPDAAVPSPATPANPTPPDAANPNPSGNGNGRVRRNANFSPEGMLDRMRTAFGVTDDAEWSAISPRITAVFEAQRAALGMGGGGMRGADGARQGTGGNPELQALREALTDKMPDAEIKARLERVRAVRKENEAKLEKARGDLLALLSVRQEAVAVMFRLVP